MKEYNKIQPEVIVGIGNDTVFLEKKSPFKTVLELHIELEDWLGDDLVECYPCYIATESLKKSIENEIFTGFEFVDMKVTKGEYFEDNYTLNKSLPKFYWMKITGIKGIDSIYIGDDSELFSSKEFSSFLQENFNTRYLDIEPERNEFDDLLDRMIAERKGHIK